MVDPSAERVTIDCSRVIVIVQTRGAIKSDLSEVLEEWRSWGATVSRSVDHTGGFIQLARNQSIQNALKYDWDYVLLNDDDVVAEPVDLLKLAGMLDRTPELYIAGGLCTSVSKVTGNQFACIQDYDKFTADYGKEGTPVVERQLSLPAQPFYVQRIGTGFTMFRRAVFEELPAPWFDIYPELSAIGSFIDGGFPKKAHKPVRKLWGDLKARISESSGYGEDYLLCDKVTGLGKRIAVNPLVRPKHYKEIQSCWPSHLLDQSDLAPLGICIPVMGRPDMLAQCLDAIKENTALDYKVVVVDNGTPEHEREPMRKLMGMAAKEFGEQLEVIMSERPLGFAGAVNAGIERLLEQGVESLCMMNSDVQPGLGWDKKLLQSLLDEPRLAAVTPLADAGAMASVKWAMESGCTGDRMHQVPFFPLFCTVIRKEAWASVGALDAEFYPAMFEDNDWCRRALLAGWSLAVNSGVMVKHACGASVAREGYQHESYINQLKCTGPRYFRKHGLAGINPRFAVDLHRWGVEVKPHLMPAELELLERMERGEPVSAAELSDAIEGRLRVVPEEAAAG